MWYLNQAPTKGIDPIATRCYQPVLDQPVIKIVPGIPEKYLAVAPTLKKLNDRFLIERYTYSIGNMTILEQSINKKIKNDIFEKKIGYFEKSSLLVTKSIYENYPFCG